MKKTVAGITGGIGTGKSVVSSILLAMGYPVFTADEESKKILDDDEQVRQKVKALFGTGAYGDDGRADRAFIARSVFQDNARLEALNHILHPVVRRHFITWADRQQSAIVFKEAAILFESGSHLDTDLVIGVSAPDAIRISRVMDRDGKTEAEVKSVMENQMPAGELLKRCDFVIENDGQRLLIPQVLEILDKIKQRHPVT